MWAARTRGACGRKRTPRPSGSRPPPAGGPSPRRVPPPAPPLPQGSPPTPAIPRIPASPAAAHARTWKVLALGISLVAALRFVYILLRYDAYGIAKYFFADDSFYYFQVARKLAAGLGST